MDLDIKSQWNAVSSSRSDATTLSFNSLTGFE